MSVIFSPSVSTTPTASQPDWSNPSFSKDYSAGKFELGTDSNGNSKSTFTTDNGIVINNFYGSDGVDTKVDGYALTTSQSEGVSNLINSAANAGDFSGGGMLSMLELNSATSKTQKNKKSGGDSGAAEGASVDVALGSNGSVGLNGSMQIGNTTLTGSLTTSGNGSAVDGTFDNWFIQMAEALGEILNKLATKLKSLVESVELGTNGQPPYKDGMIIQGLSQELAFVSQALMTALNSIGDAIKTVVTAGGAAR